MCVCIYIYIYTHAYICVYTYIYIYIYMYAADKKTTLIIKNKHNIQRTNKQTTKDNDKYRNYKRTCNTMFEIKYKEHEINYNNKTNTTKNKQRKVDRNINGNDIYVEEISKITTRYTTKNDPADEMIKKK